jgi:uncharacterized protein (DUF1697 family)
MLCMVRGMRYVALLRGINVGGNRLIKMTALKACFEAEGLREVATYIQSGNVVFTATGRAVEIGARLEAALVTAFDCRTSVMLRTQKEMEAIVARAPKGFGAEPEKYRYDVIFLKPPVTVPAALKDVPTRAGVDQARAGVGVLYFSRLISKASQSQLSRLVALPIYKSVTIRNWRTTTTLLQLMATGVPATS